MLTRVPCSYFDAGGAVLDVKAKFDAQIVFVLGSPWGHYGRGVTVVTSLGHPWVRLHLKKRESAILLRGVPDMSSGL